jgi:beta-phosphoglucomutase family hydrolase
MACKVPSVAAMLGLPEAIIACLFDLDGVLTRTAEVHARAWKQMFDEYLRDHGGGTFDLVSDYDRYVDGKPRYDGVRSFLASRGIHPPESEIIALGDRKNELVHRLIEELGVDAYEGSVRYVKAAREAGMRRAVVSSSSNARAMLQAAGIAGLFEQVIDGTAVENEGLRGKPAPDTFLAAARRLGVEPPRAAVFEDALAGVQAGRAGGFGFVVGVDRAGQAQALREHGADIVVGDLGELLDADGSPAGPAGTSHGSADTPPGPASTPPGPASTPPGPAA